MPEATLSGADFKKQLREGLPKMGLFLNAHSPTVAEQLAKARKVRGRGDDENLTNTRQHQRRERIVDHRLVGHGEQMLAHDQRQRMESRPRAAGAHDSLWVT